MILPLKSGAILKDMDGRAQLCLNGAEQTARSTGQSCALRALAGAPRSLEDISALLHRQGNSRKDPAAVLDTAAFILQFGDYFDAAAEKEENKVPWEQHLH